MKTLRCYALMPFKAEFDVVYQTIQNAVRYANDDVPIECERLDARRASVQLDAELAKQLRSCDFFVVDITGANPNVMWELGYLTALGKPCIMIAQDESAFPFNVDHYRRIRYGVPRQAELLNEIREGIKEIMAAMASYRHTPDLDFASMTDEQLLEYLHVTTPLRDRPDVVAHFSAQGNPLVSNFIKYYRNQYATAIASAVTRKLPLPSRQRQEVAIDMLLSAKHHIRAITIPSRDQWLRKDTPYFDANITAAREGTGRLVFRRIVVYPDVSALDDEHPNDPEHAEVLRLYGEAGIDILRGVESDIRRFLHDTFNARFKLQNLLIVDDTAMTRADDANHDGKLITSPEEIANTIADFDGIWKYLARREQPRY